MSTRAPFWRFRASGTAEWPRQPGVPQFQFSRFRSECNNGIVRELALPHFKTIVPLDAPGDWFAQSVATLRIVSPISNGILPDKCVSSNLAHYLQSPTLERRLSASRTVRPQLYVGTVRRRTASIKVENGRSTNAREIEKEQELTGASTDERPRQNLLRRGDNLFGYGANGSAVAPGRLFHQEAREHGSSGFVEPLLEEHINFLLQIGRMVQPGKFKRLQCWDGSLQKVLPWRANTLGIHFGGSP